MVRFIPAMPNADDLDAPILYQEWAGTFNVCLRIGATRSGVRSFQFFVRTGAFPCVSTNIEISIVVRTPACRTFRTWGYRVKVGPIYSRVCDPPRLVVQKHESSTRHTRVTCKTLGAHNVNLVEQPQTPEPQTIPSALHF